jgi:hypothetical protein
MHRPIASTLLALLLLGAAPAAGHGQAATRDGSRPRASALMTPGAHVRVKLPREHMWTGTLVSLADDSMLVHGASGADTTLIRLSEVSELYVSAGMRRSRHLVRNTVIGVVAGSGLGWMVGRSRTITCEVDDPCFEPSCIIICRTWGYALGDHATAGTVVGGLVGGTLGLLVSRVRREDWRPVAVPPRRTAVTLSPSGGMVAIRF